MIAFIHIVSRLLADLVGLVALSVTPRQPYPLSGGLEPGMIICIESYIGSAAAGQGVKLEEQLLVTETGAEHLSTFHYDARLMTRMV